MRRSKPVAADEEERGNSSRTAEPVNFKEPKSLK
jgi:hypothetical protein